MSTSPDQMQQDFAQMQQGFMGNLIGGKPIQQAPAWNYGFLGGLLGGGMPQQGNEPTPVPPEQPPSAGTPPSQQSGGYGGVFGMPPMNPFMGFGGGMFQPPPPSNWEKPEFKESPLKGDRDNEITIKVEQDMQQPAPPTTQPVQPPQQMQPYPQPAPPGQPPGQPYSPFQGPSPVPPATPAPPPAALPGMPPPSVGGGVGNVNAPMPKRPEQEDPNLWTPEERAAYGGQGMFNKPGEADYGSVQNYSDQAYDQSQRWMEPQHAEQNRRMQQELINKGIDPNSAQGQEMQNRLSMQQADQQNAAKFNALQFGQGIQQQMHGQEQDRANRAAQMQQALWGNQLGASGQGLQKYMADQQANLGWGGLRSQHGLGLAGLNMQGQLANMQNKLAGRGQDINYMLGAAGLENQYNLGRAGQDLQRYGMDQNYGLGQGQLDMARQGQDFGQMKDLWAMDRQGGQDQFQRDMYQDQMLMQMLGFNKPGQAWTGSGQGFGQSLLNSAGQDKGLLGDLSGIFGGLM